MSQDAARDSCEPENAEGGGDRRHRLFRSFSFLCSGCFARLCRPIRLSLARGWRSDVKSAGFALNIIPFAGIAFLWFIGVLRDHLGQLEDQFFATVFLGSGLLFLAMFFASAAMIGAVILVHASIQSGGDDQFGGIPCRPRARISLS